MNRFVVISGCSGGGKSTLLAELRRRGHTVVEEPGRRIVAAELAQDSGALPWIDLTAFLHRAMALARADLEQARDRTGWVFFDRGLVDAAAGLHRVTGAAPPAASPYGRIVFLTPPWPEIYRTDPARRHGFDEAVAEYDHLRETYGALGHEVVTIPRMDVAARADFVLRRLAAETRSPAPASP